MGLLSWGLGGGLAAWWFGTLYQETIGGPGGAAAFAALAQPTADAMRPLTGVAERLDTYGGYFTYHNLGYIALFLAVYAGIQGARAIRGDEERGLAELWLSTGRPRWTLVLARATAFAAVLVLIVGMAGTGIGVSCVAAGFPDWAGSYAAIGEVALAAFVVYCAGMLASQLTRTARSAATWTGFAVAVAYLVNNMSGEWSGLGWLRWLTPFAYTEQSRALVPGHGVDIAATAVLVLAAAAFSVAAAALYAIRDSGAPLRARVRPETVAAPRIQLGRWSNRDLWVLTIREQAIAVAAWTLLAMLLEWLYVSLGRTVIEAWGDNALVREIFFRSAPGSLTDQYISFTVIITAGVAVAFVVVQAAHWLGDVGHGRAEMALAQGVGRRRLVLERAMSVMVGVMVISAGGIAGLLAGVLSAGLTVNGGGLLRTLASTVLLGLAVSGVALLAVAWLRRAASIMVLTLVLAASWLVTLFGGIAHLPDWLVRASIFDAFGNPYVASARTESVVYLAALAVIGCALAVAVTARRSSITP